MTDYDVTARLMAVQPLPRGERLACRYASDRRPTKRAWNLMLRSRVIGALAEFLEREDPACLP